MTEQNSVGNKQDEVRLDLQEHADAETTRAERVLCELTLRNREYACMFNGYREKGV